MGTALRGAVASIAAALLVTLLPALPSASASPVRPDVRSQQLRVSVERERVVRLSIAATHVLLSWPAPPDHEPHADHQPPADHELAQHSRMTVAFSRDGVAFHPPLEILPDHSAEGDDGRAYSGMLWTGGARFVRIATAQPLADVRLTAIDAGRTPLGTRPSHTAAAAVDAPPIIARAGWGADESLRFQEVDGVVVDLWPPEFYPLQKLIVHHTAGANNDPDPAATVRAIHYYNAVERGWGDIGYNFLIDESGRIYEGRYSRAYLPEEIPSADDGLGNTVVGGHTLGHNAGTLGIVLLGNLVDRDATPAARAALEWLLAWLAERHSIDPLAGGLYTNPVTGTQKTRPNIAGHRDWSATQCPGGTFYPTLPALRQAVADRIAAGGSPVIPPPELKNPPDAAELSAVTAPKRPGVRLRWSVPADGGSPITEYRVLRLKKGRYRIIATLDPSTTRFRDADTRAGRTYTYVVRAFNAIGRSPFSNEARATAR